MKRFTLIMLGLLISFSVFSQGNRGDIEKRYRSQKIAFITDKMQLTPEEAQKFWPLYNQLETEKDTLAKIIRKYHSTFPEDKSEITEEQASEFLEFFNKHNADMLKLNLDYQKKYLKVIPAKKILLLNDAENEFRRHLLQEFRGRSENRPPD